MSDTSSRVRLGTNYILLLRGFEPAGARLGILEVFGISTISHAVMWFLLRIFMTV